MIVEAIGCEAPIDNNLKKLIKTIKETSRDNIDSITFMMDGESCWTINDEDSVLKYGEDYIIVSSLKNTIFIDMNYVMWWKLKYKKQLDKYHPPESIGAKMEYMEDKLNVLKKQLKEAINTNDTGCTYSDEELDEILNNPLRLYEIFKEAPIHKDNHCKCSPVNKDEEENGLCDQYHYTINSINNYKPKKGAYKEAEKIYIKKTSDGYLYLCIDEKTHNIYYRLSSVIGLELLKSLTNEMKKEGFL